MLPRTHVGVPAHIIDGLPPAHISAQLLPAHEHVESPSQVTVHVPIPAAQVTTHFAPPVQFAVAPGESARLQVVMPWHEMTVLVPAETSQVEPPAQLAVELVPSAWLQLDCPSHCAVQPLVQLRLPVFLASHASH